MAGHCVSVVKVCVLANVESNLTAGVHPDFKVTLRVDLLDRAEITVSNFQFFGWRGELNPCSPGAGVARCRPLPRA